jgi:hypothetical protein
MAGPGIAASIKPGYGGAPGVKTENEQLTVTLPPDTHYSGKRRSSQVTVIYLQTAN